MPQVALVVRANEMPVIHTSGRWLAYADKRVVHVWDTGQAADVASLYVSFQDPETAREWSLASADRLTADETPFSRLGLQVAASSGARLTATPFLLIASAPTEPRRTLQLWNAEQIYAAAALLDERRLVTSRTGVAGVTYESVTVKVRLVAQRGADHSRLRKEVERKLVGFFDPFHGGPDHTGWPLGRGVYESEICQMVEGVPGVDYVDRVVFPGAAGAETCGSNCRSVPPLSLVNADLAVEVAGDARDFLRGETSLGKMPAGVLADNKPAVVKVPSGSTLPATLEPGTIPEDKSPDGSRPE